MRRHSHARTAGWLALNISRFSFPLLSSRPVLADVLILFFQMFNFIRTLSRTYKKTFSDNLRRRLEISWHHCRPYGANSGPRSSSLGAGSAAMVTMHDGPRRTSLAGLFGKKDCGRHFQTERERAPGRAAFVRVWEEAIARVFGSWREQVDRGTVEQNQTKIKRNNRRKKNKTVPDARTSHVTTRQE